MMVDEKAAIDRVVFVDADGDHFYVGHFVLHGEERGQFFNTRGAPGGPEIQQNDVTAIVREIDAVRAVADLKCGGRLIDVCGVCSAVASCEEDCSGEAGERGESAGRKHCTYNTASDGPPIYNRYGARAKRRGHGAERDRSGEE